MISKYCCIKKYIIILIGLFLTSLAFGQSKTDINTCDRLKAEVFEPGQISTQEEYEFGISLTQRNNEAYFGVRLNEDWKAEIRYSKFEKGKWSNSQRLPLDTSYTYNDPFLNDAEDKLYFVSNRPINGIGKPKDFDIWYLEKSESGWSKPIHTGNVLNSAKDEFYVTISKKGTVYFVSNRHTKNEEDRWNHDIYYSEFINGKYQQAIRLNDLVNSESFECDPYISPDESFLIFSSSRPGGFGEGDLYIAFKNMNGEWTKPINMGEKINTSYHEFCPQISKDGKYFFYTSKGDIYKISSKIINELKH